MLYPTRAFYRIHAGRDLSPYNLSHWPKLDLPPNLVLTPLQDYLTVFAAYTRR